MGIRFLCHNCERRLNVKATQAGEHGQCPHCHITVLVPQESTIPTSLQKAKQQRRGERRAVGVDSAVDLFDADEQITLDGPLPGGSMPDYTEIPIEVPAKIDSTPYFLDELSDPAEESSELFMLDKPQLPNSLGKVDPIAAAPNRIWYFRSKTLGEFGPLKGSAMQQFLDEGELSVGCIVWRDDWNDWMKAEKVFPTLAEQAKAIRRDKRVQMATEDASYQIPDELNPYSDVARRKRRRQWLFAIAIAGGVLLVSLLSYTLIKIVSG